MMSAGLIGSEGLGYSKDRFSAAALQEADAAVYAEYKAAEPSKFLFLKDVNGLDGTKLGAVQGKLADARAILTKGGAEGLLADVSKLEGKDAEDAKAKNESLRATESMLKAAGVLKPGGSKNMADATKALTPEELKVQEASITGDRKTLKADSFIPLTMALIYLALMLYFKAIGGYKALTIEEQEA